MNNYHLFLISFFVFGFYFFTFYLSKIKKISPLAHRSLWNIILLISFIISGLLGLILTTYFSPILLWIHVEFGIIMALISIFHILWHLPYFKNIFTRK